jgi:hypothetical protein
LDDDALVIPIATKLDSMASVLSLKKHLMLLDKMVLYMLLMVMPVLSVPSLIGLQ